MNLPDLFLERYRTLPKESPDLYPEFVRHGLVDAPTIDGDTIVLPISGRFDPLTRKKYDAVWIPGASVLLVGLVNLPELDDDGNAVGRGEPIRLTHVFERPGKAWRVASERSVQPRLAHLRKQLRGQLADVDAALEAP